MGQANGLRTRRMILRNKAPFLLSLRKPLPSQSPGRSLRWTTQSPLCAPFIAFALLSSQLSPYITFHQVYWLDYPILHNDYKTCMMPVPSTMHRP